MLGDLTKRKDGKLDYRLFNFIFFSIFVNYVVESLLLLYEDRTFIISFQVLFNLVCIVIFFIIKGRISRSDTYKYVIWLPIYFLFLGLFSSSLPITYNYLFKFIIPFVYFLIGYNCMTNPIFLSIFIARSWLFMAYFSIWIIFANVTQTGFSLYPGGIKIAYFSLNALYVPVFAAIMSVYNFGSIKSKILKLLNVVFAISTILIIVLLMKRTLIVLVILAAVLLIFRNFTFKNIVKYSFISVVLFVFFFSFFESSFYQAIDTRSSRFSSEYDITEEGRFIENEYIFQLLKDSPLKMIFGSGEVFNDGDSLAAMSPYYYVRDAHNSYIRIFWNGGIVGLFSFLLLYLIQMKYLVNGYRRTKFSSKALADCFFFGIVFVFLRFVNDFSSGITYLGFNAYSYFFIAGLIRISTFRFFKRSDKPSKEKADYEPVKY